MTFDEWFDTTYYYAEIDIDGLRKAFAAGREEGMTDAASLVRNYPVLERTFETSAREQYAQRIKSARDTT